MLFTLVDKIAPLVYVYVQISV